MNLDYASGEINIGRFAKTDKKYVVDMYMPENGFVYFIIRDQTKKKKVICSFIVCPHKRIGNEGADYKDFCDDCYQKGLDEILHRKKK